MKTPPFLAEWLIVWHQTQVVWWEHPIVWTARLIKSTRSQFNASLAPRFTKVNVTGR